MKYSKLVPFKKVFIIEVIFLAISLLSIAIAIFLSSSYVFYNVNDVFEQMDSYILRWLLFLLTGIFVFFGTLAVFIHLLEVIRKMHAKINDFVFIVIGIGIGILVAFLTFVLLNFTIMASSPHILEFLSAVSGIFLIEFFYLVFVIIIIIKISKNMPGKQVK